MTSDSEIRENIPLSKYSSWKVGGAAQYFSLPRSVQELQGNVRWANEQSLPVTILGGGTNVLISDNGISGLVICLRNLTGLEISPTENRLVIEAYSGTSKSELLKVFLKFQLSPALFLAGLPGDVGGGVAMNAGVGETLEPREFFQIVDWVEVLRGEKVVRISGADIQWSYRKSEGWQPGIITRVGLSWPLDKKTNLLDEVKDMNQARLKKQPLNWPSCGSVFTNPKGYKSGQLIEEVGLKGYTVGGAQVSEKHGNFIINLGGATATEINQLIRHIQKTVLEQKNVKLSNEVVYMGNWGEDERQ